MSPIQPPQKDPAGYDTVIIGTPVWVQRPPPPVQAYLQQQAGAIRQVAIFCTLGGSGEQQAFAELSRLCGKSPAATIAVTEKNLAAPAHAAELAAFVASLPAGAVAKRAPANPSIPVFKRALS